MSTPPPTDQTTGEQAGALPPRLNDGRPITGLVVPVVDGSLHDRVVPLAGLLAEVWDLPVELVHVSPATGEGGDPELEEVLEGMRQWYPDLRLASRHLTGDDPAVAIAGAAGPDTLVVMSTDHIDRWSFKDSVADHVIDRLSSPVLLAGPAVTKRDVRRRGLGGEVVVGVDGSGAEEHAVEAALALATAMDRRLWLVDVVPQPGADPSADDLPGRHLQDLAERCNQQVSTRWEVVQGNDPIAVLEGFAARRDASFLVAATHGRHSTERHTMASVAAGLASIAARPVLVVSVPAP